MANCDTYLLSGVVDNYMIDRQISKKKYQAAYMVMAKKEWQKLFRSTIWTVQNKWMTLKKGEPYNYIDLPDDVSRLLSVSVEDKKCGLVQPLFYNPQLSVVAKPTVKKCGCKDDGCTCGGVCESANSMTYTTTFKFNYAGTDYYEKCWQELCPNGDIIEYCEIPTIKYLDTLGTPGDYNFDYTYDYLIGFPPASNFVIDVTKRQRKICHLDVQPCGCPEETESNADLLTNTCGCNLNWGCGCKERHCRQYEQNINNNHLGEIKLSECGTKIFYKPSRNWQQWNDKKFPDFLLVSYQTNGLNINSDVLVPDWSLDALVAGIYWRSIRFNPVVSAVVKQEARYQYEDEVSRVVGFMNSLSLVEIGKIQDIYVKW